mmetsp:Transcript_116838/g.277567  ORF Transcript_116838/g.277567 Transcript_116838/m.277567 type:complete len:340 (+) Transcript_116838:682-1701(+)
MPSSAFIFCMHLHSSSKLSSPSPFTSAAAKHDLEYFCIFCLSSKASLIRFASLCSFCSASTSSGAIGSGAEVGELGVSSAFSAREGAGDRLFTVCFRSLTINAFCSSRARPSRSVCAFWSCRLCGGLVGLLPGLPGLHGLPGLRVRAGEAGITATALAPTLGEGGALIRVLGDVTEVGLAPGALVTELRSLRSPRSLGALRSLRSVMLRSGGPWGVLTPLFGNGAGGGTSFRSMRGLPPPSLPGGTTSRGAGRSTGLRRASPLEWGSPVCVLDFTKTCSLGLATGVVSWGPFSTPLVFALTKTLCPGGLLAPVSGRGERVRPTGPVSDRGDIVRATWPG